MKKDATSPPPDQSNDNSADGVTKGQQIDETLTKKTASSKESVISGSTSMKTKASLVAVAVDDDDGGVKNDGDELPLKTKSKASQQEQQGSQEIGKDEEEEESSARKIPTSRSSSVHLLEVPGIVVSFSGGDSNGSISGRRDSIPNMRRRYSREMQVHYTELLRQATLDQTTSLPPSKINESREEEGKDDEEEESLDSDSSTSYCPSSSDGEDEDEEMSDKRYIDSQRPPRLAEIKAKKIDIVENGTSDSDVILEDQEEQQVIKTDDHELKVENNKDISNITTNQGDEVDIKESTTDDKTADIFTIDLSTVKAFDIRDRKVCRISISSRNKIFQNRKKDQPRSLSFHESRPEIVIGQRSQSLADENFLTIGTGKIEGEKASSDSEIFDTSSSMAANVESTHQTSVDSLEDKKSTTTSTSNNELLTVLQGGNGSKDGDSIKEEDEEADELGISDDKDTKAGNGISLRASGKINDDINLPGDQNDDDDDIKEGDEEADDLSISDDKDTSGKINLPGDQKEKALKATNDKKQKTLSNESDLSNKDIESIINKETIDSTAGAVVVEDSDEVNRSSTTNGDGVLSDNDKASLLPDIVPPEEGKKSKQHMKIGKDDEDGVKVVDGDDQKKNKKLDENENLSAQQQRDVDDANKTKGKNVEKQKLLIQESKNRKRRKGKSMCLICIDLPKDSIKKTCNSLLMPLDPNALNVPLCPQTNYTKMQFKNEKNLSLTFFFQVSIKMKLLMSEIINFNNLVGISLLLF